MSSRPRISKQFLDRNRQERIIRATIAAVDEHGYRACTVAHIVSAAGIARNTFYETFSGKEAAFEATVEWIIGQAVLELEAPHNEGLAGIDVLANYVLRESASARCVLVECMGALPEVYEANVLAVARQTGLEEKLALMVVGGVAAIFYRHLARGDAIPLADLREFVAPHFDGVAA